MTREIKKILKQIAKNNGVSVDQVVQEINLAIGSAWSTASTEKKLFQNKHFAHKPTAEEFILKAALLVQNPKL